MFGLKHIPHCAGCGVDNQQLLVRRGVGFCAQCVWAISQRKDMDSKRIENEMRADELKYGKDSIEAGIIEGAILLERNGELRSELIKSHRRIKQLESVK